MMSDFRGEGGKMTQRNPTLVRGGSKMTQKGPTSFMDVFFKKIITSLPHEYRYVNF